MLSFVIPITLLLRLPSGAPPVPCQTPAANAEIRQIMASLPADNVLRQMLKDGQRGDGVRRPWMDQMRKLGVGSALVETRFEWDNRPTNVQVYRTLFFKSHYPYENQIVEPGRLAEFQANGLQKELEGEAIGETSKETSWGFEKHASDIHQGVGYVRFLSDECLPELRPTLEAVDPHETPLMRAVDLGDRLAVADLLAKGASKADLDSALFLAAAQDSPTILRALIAAGGDVNTSATPDGESPLTLAVRSGKLENVRWLIDAAADVNRKDAMGEPPIVVGARFTLDRSCAVEIAHLLLRTGADPNARDSDGYSALSSARSRRFPQLVQVLIDAGANK
jgi:Ankyrin repeats (3 copies)